MIKLRHYDDKRAGQVARIFFTNEYHDPGIQKWGGFRTGSWENNLTKNEGRQKNSK